MSFALESAALESALAKTIARFGEIPGLTVEQNVRLAHHTRFGIGGPAAVFVCVAGIPGFLTALQVAKDSGLSFAIVGAGSNLVVADEGFAGIVLKLTANSLSTNGTDVDVDAGAVLQDLVDFTVDCGLAGVHSMAGIPGFTGAAIYGNAGAYGHSMHEVVKTVRIFDGAAILEFNNAECEFEYRGSIFKKHKDWTILSARLTLRPDDAATLREEADKILAVRNKKYPPTMKCAGSIFKNYLLKNLPANVAEQVPAGVVIEGKVPSAWFLEQVGAKGMSEGDIHVADYHANLIYNGGNGTAREIRRIIDELKRRVGERWGIPLEEEVQYIGFANG